MAGAWGVTQTPGTLAMIGRFVATAPLLALRAEKVPGLVVVIKKSHGGEEA